MPIASDMNTIILTCGCGRVVPDAAIEAATVQKKSHVCCTECGARGRVTALLNIKVGGQYCGVCGSLKCADGCCCAC